MYEAQMYQWICVQSMHYNSHQYFHFYRNDGIRSCWGASYLIVVQLLTGQDLPIPPHSKYFEVPKHTGHISEVV